MRPSMPSWQRRACAHRHERRDLLGRQDKRTKRVYRDVTPRTLAVVEYLKGRIRRKGCMWPDGRKEQDRKERAGGADERLEALE